MTESKEELNSLLMRVKEESGKVGLKHKIQKTKNILPVLEGVGSRGVVSALEAGAGWWDVVRVGAWGEMP